MVKIWALFLLGALGLAGYDSFRSRRAPAPPPPVEESGQVSAYEDGTGFPPPKP